MNVLMIGGSGQLGYFTLKHLHAIGNDLTAIGIGKAPEPGYLPKGTRYMDFNIETASESEIQHQLEGMDVVIYAGFGFSAGRH